MASTKSILMVAGEKKVEALRMASGLTLLDAQVAVLVLGDVPGDAEAREQFDALAFAELPILYGVGAGALELLAHHILRSDAVFIV